MGGTWDISRPVLSVLSPLRGCAILVLSRKLFLLATAALRLQPRCESLIDSACLGVGCLINVVWLLRAVVPVWNTAISNFKEFLEVKHT